MKQKFRKTKVIATIGPACDDIPTLKAMIAAGMNVARLNMSHGNEASHAATLDRIRQAAAEMETSVAVMLDTRGREIRTGRLHSGEVLLERHHHITLYNDGRIGDEHGVSISLPGYHRHAQRNDRALIDDGQIELIVTGVEGEAIHCRVECGGILNVTRLPGRGRLFFLYSPHMLGHHVDVEGSYRWQRIDLARPIELAQPTTSLN